MKDDKTTHELKSAEDLHRFEASMMLGQTAVYLLVNGALLNAVAGKDVSDFNRIGIAIFGIVLSLGYLLISHRTGVNLRGSRKRAEELCEELGFKLYSPEYRAPRNRILVSKNVTKSICIFGGVFWIVILLRILCG